MMRSTAIITRRVALAALTIGVARPSFAQARASFKIGDIGVRVFDDGHMMVPRDRIASVDADETRLSAELTPRGAVEPPTHVRFSLNVTLLEIDGKRVLIDAGAGGTWVPDGGKLGDALQAAGIDAASIDHVVLTHAHPDHLWGVIDDFDGSLRFPNAAYTIPNGEFEFWMSPTAPEAARADAGVIAGARRVLRRIEAKLTRAANDAQVLPGVAYLDAAGHTPGQCAVLVQSGGQKLLIATDTLFHPIVSVAHPTWRPAQDMDGDVAVASRLRLLDIAATEHARVLAYHIADLSGSIVKAGNGYLWLGQP